MNKSFTLIEILIVIVIIGTLSSFILIGMNSVSESANIAKNKSFSNSLRNSLLINLISEWKFDDLLVATNGSIVIDSWRNINGTLLTNDADDKLRTGSQCVSKNCLHFDGSNDYISFDASDFFIINKSLTIESWVKQIKDSQAVQYIVSNDRDMSPPIGGYETHIRSNGLFYGCIWRKSTGTRACVSGTSVPENIWHHVVLTFNGQNLKVYQNGVLSGNASIVDEIENPSQNFTIGCLAYNRPTYYRFNGTIDDIRIYNQAVSMSEIQNHYFAGINKLYKNNGITLDEFNQRIGELKNNLVNNK